MATKKAQYAPSSQQVDLEQRLGNGNKSDNVLSTADTFEGARGDDGTPGREYAVEGNDTDDYLNVDPVYQTYANDTEAPARAEKGVESDLDDILHGDAVATVDGVKSVDEVEDLKQAKLDAQKGDGEDSDKSDDDEGAGQSQASGGTNVGTTENTGQGS